MSDMFAVDAAKAAAHNGPTWRVEEAPYTGAKQIANREIVRFQMLDEPPFFLTERQAMAISDDLRRVVFSLRRARA